MTNEVSICNGALIKLGADTIIALTDENNRARTLSARFAEVRDAELRRRRWRFSIRRESLPALSTVPDSDYLYQYQVPNDFLRLINGGDIVQTVDLSDYRSRTSQLYSLENRKILTNLPAPLAIRYIAQITDAAQFDSAFAEAFAARLAFECCEKITQSDSKKQICWSDYRNTIREAVAANAVEVASESIGDDTWVMARTM